MRTAVQCSVRSRAVHGVQCSASVPVPVLNSLSWAGRVTQATRQLPLSAVEISPQTRGLTRQSHHLTALRCSVHIHWFLCWCRYSSVIGLSLPPKMSSSARTPLAPLASMEDISQVNTPLPTPGPSPRTRHRYNMVQWYSMYICIVVFSHLRLSWLFIISLFSTKSSAAQASFKIIAIWWTTRLAASMS